MQQVRQRRRPRQGVLLALFLLPQLSGFDASAATALEPCSVLTAADIDQVVGKLTGEPKANRVDLAAWCDYQFANGTDALEVWVLPANGLEQARKKAKKPVSVKELGNDAFMDRGAHGLDYVDLFIKNNAVTVELSLKETAHDEAQLRALGAKALSRLR